MNRHLAGVGGGVLNATFEFEMPQALDEAVQKGIAIYFNIEFELYRKRWYWLDRKVSTSTLTYRLSFSPLTRQFRLARGGLSQPFESLDEALGLLKSVRQWKVIEKGMLSPGDSFEAQVRMRLDVNQLPKPSRSTPSPAASGTSHPTGTSLRCRPSWRAEAMNRPVLSARGPIALTRGTCRVAGPAARNPARRRRGRPD